MVVKNESMLVADKAVRADIIAVLDWLLSMDDKPDCRSTVLRAFNISEEDI